MHSVQLGEFRHVAMLHRKTSLPHCVGINRGMQEHQESRLVISQLELENFKSYGGVRVIGPFHQRFSSIVGPNGSGKSNVLDAMLFAFGKRAKDMRLSKVSELIHKSDAFPDLPFARVTVSFMEIMDHPEEEEEGKAGEDTFDIVPDTSFTISRVAYLNNTSKYFIGDKTSSFGEVTKMLLAKDIDLNNNRFLILQGEVEQISMMKPKALTSNETGLLEYLEDIIGSNKYVEQIDTTMVELDQLAEVRHEKMNLFKVAEKELDSLKMAKNEALDFNYKIVEKNKLTCSMYQLELLNDTKRSTKLADNRDAAQQKLENLRIESKDNAEKLEQIEVEYAAVKLESTDLLAKVEEFEGQFRELEKADIQKRERIKHIKAAMSKHTTALNKDRKQIAKLEATIESLTEEIPTLEEEVVDSQKEVEKSQKRRDKVFDAVKEKTAPFRDSLEAKQKELIPFSQRRNECQSILDTHKSELALYVKKIDKANAEYEKACKFLEKVTSDVSEKEAMFEVASDAANSAARALLKLEKDNASLVETEEGLKATVNELRGRLADAEDALSSEKHRGKAMAALLKAKQKNILPGVLGRLGDLGSIDAKYDVSMSTSCAGLDYVVVDTVSTAQAVVGFLRKYGLGTLTCLVLEKQTTNKQLMQAMSRPFKAPKGSDRLFDLINVRDERVLPAFYFAIRDTLVAPNLDEARRISYGQKPRARVVSLSGDLVETTGAMSGGGTKQIKGRIQLGSGKGNPADSGYTPEEVREMKSTLEASETRLEKLIAIKMEHVKRSMDLKKEKSTSELRTRKLTMELENLRDRATEGTARLKELKRAATTSSADSKKISKLEKEVGEAEEGLEEAVGAAKGLEGEIAQLERRIMDAGGSKLKSANAELESATKALDDLQSSIVKKGVEIENSQKTVVRLSKKISKAEDELAVLDSDKSAVSEELAVLEREGFEVVTQKEEYTDKAKAVMEKLQAMSSEHDKVQKHFDRFRSKELDLINRLEDFAKSYDEVEVKISSLLERIESISALILSGLVELKDLVDDDEPGEEQHAWEWKLFTEEEVERLRLDDLKYEIAMLEETLTRMSPDMSAVEEYRTKKVDFEKKCAALEAVTAERDAKREIYDGLRKQRLEEFMEGFSIISMKLKEMYQMLTLGGDAELELVDNLDPFSEGIVFSVRPPKKSWKNISNLSGGEKVFVLNSCHY